MSDKDAGMKDTGLHKAGKMILKPDNVEPPFHFYPSPPMELFDPGIHLASSSRSYAGPTSASAIQSLQAASKLHPERLLIPRAEDCRALWDLYPMLAHIRVHSAMVADMAQAIGREAKERGMDVSPEALLAAGLLHDLGKTYTIAHGGSHAQLGAAWVMRETRNGPIAQSVLFHVHWPWSEDLLEDERLLLTAITLYADKRVMHDAYVSLDERFEDLYVRYGVNEYTRERIAASYMQGKYVEAMLSRLLGVELHEHIADSGRLVERT